MEEIPQRPQCVLQSFSEKELRRSFSYRNSPQSYVFLIFEILRQYRDSHREGGRSSEELDRIVQVNLVSLENRIPSMRIPRDLIGSLLIGDPCMSSPAVRVQLGWTPQGFADREIVQRRMLKR